jgi:ankyrin repeat protein
MSDYPLYLAARNGDIERARELIAQGHDVNKRPRFTRSTTPLLCVLRSRYDAVPTKLDMVQFLVDYGADLEARDGDGWTPLHSAVYNSDFLIFKFLLFRGADIAAKTKLGRTVLHTIVLQDHPPAWVNLVFATTEDARTLLSMKDHNGDTPLHHAKSLVSAKALVEYGFDVATSGMESTWMCPSLLSVRNDRNRTPLERAAIYGRKEVEKYLNSFTSLPLVHLTTMKLSPGMNEFQRFLARRVYFTTLCKLPLGNKDLALRVMAFLSPGDVMK